jgi:ERCC4-type nuclease
LLGFKYVFGVGQILFQRLIQGFGSSREVNSASRSDLQINQDIGQKVVGEIKCFDVYSSEELELRLADNEGLRKFCNC